MKNPPTLVTASAMNTFTSCQRRYYLAYELCLKETRKTDALRFGTAFHAALEARANGADLSGAVNAAMGTTEAGELDACTACVLVALIGGYYRAWDGRDAIQEMRPEQAFEYRIDGPSGRPIPGFRAAGKIDGLAVLTDGRLALVEHKTTGEDISPAAAYWDRLRNNRQLYAYIDAAERSGWRIDSVIYDVIRKPTIRQTQKETVDQYSERLLKDCTEVRPEYYYARREVNIFEAAKAEFRTFRQCVISQIRSLRRLGKKSAWPGDPWLACNNQVSCRGCQFSAICQSGAKPTADDVPDGFRIGEAHEELSI